MRKTLSDIKEFICELITQVILPVLVICGIPLLLSYLDNQAEKEREQIEARATKGVFYGDWVGYTYDTDCLYNAIIRIDTNRDGKEDITAMTNVRNRFDKEHTSHSIIIYWSNNQWKVLQIDNKKFNF